MAPGLPLDRGSLQSGVVDGFPGFASLTLREFGDRLASAEPVPGGGSASAVAASLGASLVAMVASLSAGRAKYADHTSLHDEARVGALQLRDRLLALAEEDAAAYAGFAAAMKLPRETEADQRARSEAISSAARVASEVPLACLEACHAVAVWAEALAGRSNRNASSDLEVATLLASAGARGAAANVLVNLPSVGDDAWGGEVTARVDELVDDVTRLADRTREVVRGGSPRDPLPAQA